MRYPTVTQHKASNASRGFGEVGRTTLQQHGQWEQVPGSGLNARTSSFNLSHHQKTAGPSLLRPVQPSDSRCLMLLCVVRWARAGCGCGSTDDLQPSSSPLQSGCLVEQPQEVDGGQKPHSLGHSGAARASRSVVSCV